LAFFSDLRLIIRAVLNAWPAAGDVVLDYTLLVAGGYYRADEPICANARVRWAKDLPSFGPIVLLTEGRSDKRVLSVALEVMAPHLTDLFSFLDYEGVSLEGSADALAKSLRAFIAAGVTTRWWLSSTTIQLDRPLCHCSTAFTCHPISER
jgi:hypothetical protein